jgi:hypothetical protein
LAATYLVSYWFNPSTSGSDVFYDTMAMVRGCTYAPAIEPEY